MYKKAKRLKLEEDAYAVDMKRIADKFAEDVEVEAG